MLEDYELDFSKPYAWLSWGGLILPEVVRNKDGSLMGFIRYGEDRRGGQLKTDFPEGWALWLDVSHLQDEETKPLCLMWNPFCRGKSARAINGYDDAEPEKQEWPEHFRQVLMRFSEDVACLRKGSHPCGCFVVPPAKPFTSYIAKTYEGISTVGRKKFIAVRTVPVARMLPNVKRPTKTKPYV